MGRPKSLLEDLCDYACSIQVDSFRVLRQERCLRAFAERGGETFRIANFPGSSADASELRRNLQAAAKKPVRAVLGGQLSTIEVHIPENPDDAPFEVTIRPVPPPDPSVAPRFTAKQGQYLAFIHYYSKIHRQSPAESDLQRFFGVSAPSIHEMLKTLQRNGLIQRTPGAARSIKLLVLPQHLPALD